MARARRIGSRIELKSHNVGSRHWPQWAVIALTLVLSGIPFAYGKYCEFCRKGPFDGGLNIYAAKVIVDGGIVGRDIAPSARPATLLVNVVGVGICGYSELGPKLIQMLMQLGALVLMFITLRRVFGNLPACVGVVLAAFFLSCPPYAKFGNAKEQFMIACMIVAACSLMLTHSGGSKWWLLLSGGAAVNIIFFKPTGASVMIAMLVYLIAQPLLRHRTWRLFGRDVILLVAGAAIGMIPLVVFYAWQGQLQMLTNSVPGIKAISLVFSTPSDGQGKAVATGYVEASRAASAFITQYNWVMKYYRSFVVPIGFSLIAIIWWICRWAVGIVRWAKRSRRDTAASTTREHKVKDVNTGTSSVATQYADRFVLLLAIWWILDMVFVWVSPRSYVEYFLPLNGSAAMLAAYAIYRCRRQHIGVIILLFCWPAIDIILTWVVPSETAIGIGCRNSGPDGYFSGVSLHLIPFVIAIVLFVALRATRYRGVRAVFMTIICAISLVLWVGNNGNIEAFKKRVHDIHEKRRLYRVDSWERVGQMIRDNSKPGDGLYVWGWYPGIYVEARRFSPTRRPSESNMHTESPQMLKWKTESLLAQLKANPPEFIVDSQKIHYPFYTHPVFDLWPRWHDEKRNKPFMWYHPRQPVGKPIFFTLSEWHNHKKQFGDAVERLTFELTNRKIADEDYAKQLAQAERDRQEVLCAFREFVMANYKPVVSADSQMLVFRNRSRN